MELLEMTFLVMRDTQPVKTENQCRFPGICHVTYETLTDIRHYCRHMSYKKETVSLSLENIDIYIWNYNIL